MSKLRINKKSLEFLKTGFKSEKELKSIRDEYLRMRNLVKYEGEQKIMGTMFPIFTDKKTNSTFTVRKGETIKSVLDSVRGGFK